MLHNILRQLGQSCIFHATGWRPFWICSKWPPCWWVHLGPPWWLFYVLNPNSLHNLAFPPGFARLVYWSGWLICNAMLTILKQASTGQWTNAGLMLGHRLWRWPNIKPALVQCHVLSNYMTDNNSNAGLAYNNHLIEPYQIIYYIIK